MTTATHAGHSKAPPSPPTPITITTLAPHPPPPQRMLDMFKRPEDPAEHNYLYAIPGGFCVCFGPVFEPIVGVY
jgi:hypothetical protein